MRGKCYRTQRAYIQASTKKKFLSSSFFFFPPHVFSVPGPRPSRQPLRTLSLLVLSFERSQTAFLFLQSLGKSKKNTENKKKSKTLTGLPTQKDKSNLSIEQLQ